MRRILQFTGVVAMLFCFATGYAQTYTFTNAGATGYQGPTQAQVNTAYTGTPLAGQVTVTGSGIQEWQVPADGIYLIEVYGAGFDETSNQRGAYMSGEFSLQSSQTLSILVGQMGENARCGSGGSFVVDGTTPLVIAGGAGGQAENMPGDVNMMGDTAQNGQNGANTTGTSLGGINGQGGGQGGSCFAQSGAGFLGDGVGCDGVVAQSFTNGGEGATSSAVNSNGGFGGGGTGRASTNWRIGGGGGYSGGASAGNNNNSYGGGGGSFNSGANQVNIPGDHIGHGLVVISPLSSGAMNDAGVTSIDSPGVFCPGPQDVVVTVVNFGVNQITSVDVEWEVNGIPQPTFNYTGLIDTIGGTGGPTAQINLGSFTFTNAAYNVVAWTSNPNNVADTVNANDTTSATIQSNLPAPSNVNVTNLTTSSVSFNWTPGDPSNDFIYSVVTEGSAPGTGTFTSVDSATVSGLSLLSRYDIYVREICAGGGDTSAWSSPVTFQVPFVCPSNAYCFTTAGQSGPTGPTQAQVNAEYVGTNLDGMVTSNGGIQEWAVPFSGQYRITAAGAEGGTVPNNDPGKGALMSGEFLLLGGQSLSVLVGQQGESSTTTFHGGGGGGGSYVWDNNNTTLPLIAAGGGGAGGNGTSGVSASIDATDSINGGANGNGTPGGVNGAGGGGGDSGSWGGGGGAGWNSDGLDDATYGKGGSTPLNGGAGGPTTGSSQNAGGFGGGGSDGYDGGGAGGGYSGGRGGGWSGHTLRNGGGGGSYNAGTNQQNQGGINDGPGIVIIEPLSSRSPNDAGVASIDSPNVFCPDTHDIVVTVANFGINQLDSVTVNWEVNGVLQTPVQYVGLIDTAGGVGPNQVQVNIGTWPFTNAPYSFRAWTSMPNGQPDTVNLNDTTSRVIQSNLPAPSGINVTNLTSSSVSFNWTAGSASNDFLYTVVPTGTSPGQGTFTSADSATVGGLALLSVYDIYVREICAGGGDTSAWSSPVTFQVPFVCPSNAYCFTTAGVSGPIGPTQAQVNAEYVGTNLDGQVTSNGGIQEWTVPFSGQYRITAAGAEGGTVPNNDPGKGALMSGDFLLTGNQSLSILVGQQGESSTATFHGGGGGGGSFVWDNNNTTLPLIAAGGGGAGGNGTSGVSPSIDATDSINGGANGNGTPGGVNGAGGGGGDSGSWGGGGGAGWNSDGLNDGTYGYGGFTPLNGGQGGPTTGSGQNAGGFGGGGSDGYDGGGAGGGYSGGRGGGFSGHTLRNGGGGGSYNAGTNQQNQGGINDGPGIVIIEPISFPAPNDAGITSIENPLDSVFCDTPEDLNVNIRNFGTEQLDSAWIHMVINGDTLTPFPFVGPLDTVNGTGPVEQVVTIGSYAFTQSGFYDVTTWTTMPNGQPDTVNVNDTATKTVFVKLMDLQTTSVTEPLCHGDPTGSISVTSTAVNPTYLWFHGPTGDVVTGLPGGTYTVVVTGDFSCPDTLDITINEPDPLDYDIVDGGSVSCNGDVDGVLEIEGDGGTPPYTYFWADGTPGNRIENRPPGMYDVTITDSNNCEAQLSIEIIDPAPLAINEDSVVMASCFGYNDATIALNATGGTTPYTWNWNTGDTSGVLAGIFGGETYSVTLVDANGCEDDYSQFINQPDQLDTNVTNQHRSLLIANYDFGDATYEWWDCDLGALVPGENNREFEPTDNGNYALIITIDDCQDTSSCHVLDRVSAEDLTNEANSFTIYPNPNNGLFNVRLTGNGNADVQMQIVDMQGKVLTAKTLGRIEGELVEEVSMNLAAGVYFVKVIRDGNLSVKRVVVQ